MTLVLRTIAAAREWVREQRRLGKTIGLVPTLGALHDGHASHFRRARAQCDCVAISIFVNPLQFAAGEDYERYPRPWENDLKMAEKEAVDAVFAPEAKEMYPAPEEIAVEPGKLGSVLEGASRPGHFRGVLTVVAKLFHILQPDRAYFGQKDAQQAILIQRMVAELNFPLAVEVGPTVRESDGLAVSSRNAYLNAEERVWAAVLYRSLKRAEELFQSGVRDARCLEQEMQQMIHAAPKTVLDYASVVDGRTLEPLVFVDRPALAAVAVRLGRTRLIDNVILDPSRDLPAEAGRKATGS